MDNDDISFQPRSQLGKRAKRTTRRMQSMTTDDIFEHVHKPFMQKSWEKARADARYQQRRDTYKYLELIHMAFASLPQDIIYMIQERAGIMVQSMPLPKVIRTRTCSSTN